MRILIVATKTPWPPIDGGRLLLLNTIRALQRAGDEVTLVAPADPQQLDIDRVRSELDTLCRAEVVESRTLGALPTVVRSEWTGTPLTIVRHAQDNVRLAVDRLLAAERFDVVHAEQQQAVAQTGSARQRGVPVVLRAQNVESRLWVFASRYRNPMVRPVFLREARRLAAWEGRCVDAASLTVAVTASDAANLRTLSRRGAKVVVVPPPFAVRLPPGPRRLAGDPAIAILASRRWVPNRDAVWRFVAEAWPRISQLSPGARLHVFGITPSGFRAPNVEWHRPPERSHDAFPEGGVVAIPSRHPTGIPMKGLEAWARGLPVAASTEAAEQLGAVDGHDILVADSTERFARAVALLAERPELRSQLVAGARNSLATRYSSSRVAEVLREAYRDAISGVPENTASDGVGRNIEVETQVLAR